MFLHARTCLTPALERLLCVQVIAQQSAPAKSARQPSPCLAEPTGISDDCRPSLSRKPISRLMWLAPECRNLLWRPKSGWTLQPTGVRNRRCSLDNWSGQWHCSQPCTVCQFSRLRDLYCLPWNRVWAWDRTHPHKMAKRHRCVKALATFRPGRFYV